jgi:hypothetical protein
MAVPLEFPSKKEGLGAVSCFNRLKFLMHTQFNLQLGFITTFRKKLQLSFRKKLGLKWELTLAPVCLNLLFWKKNMKP